MRLFTWRRDAGIDTCHGDTAQVRCRGLRRGGRCVRASYHSRSCERRQVCWADKRRVGKARGHVRSRLHGAGEPVQSQGRVEGPLRQVSAAFLKATHLMCLRCLGSRFAPGRRLGAVAGVSYGCAHYARRYLPESTVWRDRDIKVREGITHGAQIGLVAFGGLYAAHLATSVRHHIMGDPCTIGSASVRGWLRAPRSLPKQTDMRIWRPGLMMSRCT